MRNCENTEPVIITLMIVYRKMNCIEPVVNGNWLYCTTAEKLIKFLIISVKIGVTGKELVSGDIIIPLFGQNNKNKRRKQNIWHFLLQEQYINTNNTQRICILFL